MLLNPPPKTNQPSNSAVQRLLAAARVDDVGAAGGGGVEDGVLPEDELGRRHLLDQPGHVGELGPVPIVPVECCPPAHVKNVLSISTHQKRQD